MNLANERKLAARATALGESASADAGPELAELTRSASPLVRRLAASALGKLAGIVDSAASVCDHCFDEVYLARRNFDTKVELNKTIRAADGTLVQSEGKRLISLYREDAPRLEQTLADQLPRHLRLASGGDASPPSALEDN